MHWAFARYQKNYRQCQWRAARDHVCPGKSWVTHTHTYTRVHTHTYTHTHTISLSLPHARTGNTQVNTDAIRSSMSLWLHTCICVAISLGLFPGGVDPINYLRPNRLYQTVADQVCGWLPIDVSLRLPKKTKNVYTWIGVILLSGYTLPRWFKSSHTPAFIKHTTVCNDGKKENPKERTFFLSFYRLLVCLLVVQNNTTRPQGAHSCKWSKFCWHKYSNPLEYSIQDILKWINQVQFYWFKIQICQRPVFERHSGGMGWLRSVGSSKL